MIKLVRNPCPSELTKKTQQELTDKFRRTGTPVWKKRYIEEGLLMSSHYKCAYCECKVDREALYMEVEHYQDKHTYPNEVVNWNNLLPSCKRCNGNKSTYDTNKNDFINPYDMHPNNHLILNKYRFYPTSTAGKNTIDELLLNDSQRLVVQRFEIAEAVNTKIEELYERAIEYKNNTKRTNQNKNKIISGVENLLTEALPEASYCATVATAVVNDVHFFMVKNILEEETLWSDSMSRKMSIVESNALKTDLEEVKEYLESQPKVF